MAEQDKNEDEGRTSTVAAQARDFATEDTDTSGYVGVSPEYMTHAGVQNQPFAAEGGDEQEREELIQGRAAGAVGKPAEHEGNSTQGGGSAPLVYAHTSGENVEAEEVDRAKVHKSSTAKQEQHRPPAKKAAAPAASSSSNE